MPSEPLFQEAAVGQRAAHGPQAVGPRSQIGTVQQAGQALRQFELPPRALDAVQAEGILFRHLSGQPVLQAFMKSRVDLLQQARADRGVVQALCGSGRPGRRCRPDGSRPR